MKMIGLRKLTLMAGVVLALTTAWGVAYAGDKGYVVGLKGAPMDAAAEAATGFSPSTIDAIKARIAQATAVAQRIRAAGPIDDANYLTLSQRLLGASDAGLQAATSAISYKGALAAIRSAETKAKAQPAAAKTLGQVSRDFVFYPIVPCRLLDTRAGAGVRLTAFVPYPVDFDGGNPGNAASCTWGGVASQVGGPLGAGVDRAALAINLTVTEPLAPGFIQARPVGSTNITSNQNFLAGDTVANMAIVQDAGTLDEFELFSNASTHAVVDVMGVFAPPAATALDCVTVGPTTAACGANSVCSQNPPACAAGYTRASIACNTSNYFMYNSGFGLDVCDWHNTTASVQEGAAFSRCCRVPGR